MNTEEQQKELIEQIIGYTKELLGKDSEEWSVGVYWLYDNLGECNNTLKFIRYSIDVFENNELETIKYLVRHEVAHVGNDNHGKVWKKKVLSLGGSDRILRWDKKTKKIAI